jgi:hypothetical protein
MQKERLRIVEKDQVEQWKSTISELDKEYKSETTQLSNELWAESRRLSPRTSCLGRDILGNKYWLFSSRQTKKREFGGWVVIQAPDDLPIGATLRRPQETPIDEDDEFRDLKYWYYVGKPEDIRQLAKWAMFLASKVVLDAERKEMGSSPKGSRNKLGQSFAVEVYSPLKTKERPGKGRKIVDFAGLVDTRVLCEELDHAADWIEERYASCF